MSDSAYNILLLLNRYVHIVCTTLLVGGTLFYEMVVPVAIDELKPEQQLSVFARARWVFRGIVWSSALLLVITGIVSSYRNLGFYLGAETPVPRVPYAPVPAGMPHSFWMRAGWWWAAHVSTGIVAVLIALFLTMSRKPPMHPIPWMRLNLVILMIVIFLASATRHVRLVNQHARQGVYINAFSGD